MAVETYDKYRANKALYDSKAMSIQSSIFISPSTKNMAQTGIGLSLGISNYSVAESLLKTQIEQTKPNFQKTEIFVLQNAGLDSIFPIDMIKFDHKQRVNPNLDLNQAFSFVS